MCVQVKILTFPVCRTYEKPYFPKIIRAFQQNYSVFCKNAHIKTPFIPFSYVQARTKGPEIPEPLKNLGRRLLISVIPVQSSVCQNVSFVAVRICIKAFVDLINAVVSRIK